MATPSSSEVSPTADPVPRERHTRTRACLECRSRKVKCVQSGDLMGRCRGCARYDKECIFRERRRCRRTNLLRTRVEQLEQGLEGIVSLFSSNQHSLSIQNPDTTQAPQSITTPAASSSERRKSFVTPGVNRDASLRGDIFDRDIITIEDAIPLCALYRHMSQKHFPYVLLPEDIEINQIRAGKPLCLHAILIVASWQNPSLQLVLEDNFLKDLSARFFLKGEQSIDMIQALIVYLGWYQYVIKSPSGQQLYRLACIAATILIQLGLHKRPHDVKPNTFSPHTTINPGQIERPDSPEFWSIDARRALLGCYALCAIVSPYIRRPNPLPYSEYMEEVALSLQKENLAPSDTSLIYFLRLMHIAEEIVYAFNFGDSETGALSESKIRLCVAEFDRQITKVRNELPSDTLQFPRLNMQCWVLRAYAFEVAIYQENDSNPVVSQISMLYDCATSAKGYLDEVLLFSQDDMQEWSFMEWLQLNHVVLLISRAAHIISSTDWNDVASRLIVLDSYLEWLCERLRRIINSRPRAEVEQRTGFDYVLAIWETTKNKNRSALPAFQARPSAVSQMGQRTTSMMNGQQTDVSNASMPTDYADLMGLGPFDLGHNTFWIPSNFPA
ncbi:hypothetical protein F5884DRAFT_378940 [Xylogone sp. PMI_703]|nr:hypothetical protein F5884DRAFT_378940 [Xylogone sp. PMI_703]